MSYIVGELATPIHLQDKDWHVRLDNVKKAGDSAARRISQQFNRIGDSLISTGRTLTTRLTLPLMAMGAASVGAFGRFDAAMTQSLAIMGDVSSGMRDEMESTARHIGKTTTFGAHQAAEAYFFLASAGMDAAASIKAMPAVANFAQAGMFDLARATDLVTDAQSALGLSVREDAIKNMKNMVRVSDVLVGANTLANASVEQFAEALTNRAGAALRMVNKDMEEGVAVLAAFADQGVKGAEAGVRLDIVLRDLQTRALGNENEFKKLGITVFDAGGNLRNIADIVEDVEGALRGMSDAQVRATLMTLGFQDRSVAALLTLIGMSDAIRGYEKDLRGMAGITDEVANKQLESFKEQMGLIKDRLIDVGITIGSILAPQLVKLGDLVARVADWFDRKSKAVQLTIIATAALAAALGPAMMALGMMAKAVAGLITRVVGLKTAMLFLTGPKGLILLAAGAMATLGIIMSRTVKDINKTKERIDVLKGSMDDVNTSTNNLINTNKDLLPQLRNLKDGWNDLTKAQLDFLELQIQKEIYEIQRGANEWVKAWIWLVGVTNKVIEVNERLNKALGANRLSTEEYGASIEDLSEEEEKENKRLEELRELLQDIVQRRRDLAEKTDKQAGSSKDLNRVLSDEKTETGNLFKKRQELENQLEGLMSKTGDWTRTEIDAARALSSEISAIDELIEKREELARPLDELRNESMQVDLESFLAQLEEWTDLQDDVKDAIREATKFNDEYTESLHRMSEAEKQQLEWAMARASGMIRSARDVGNAIREEARRIIQAEFAKGLAGVLADTGLKLGILAPILGVGIGAAFSALWNNLIPSFAKGGMVHSPTLAVVGDNPGARTDPEVISPLSKLTGHIERAVSGIPIQEINIHQERESPLSRIAGYIDRAVSGLVLPQEVNIPQERETPISRMIGHIDRAISGIVFPTQDIELPTQEANVESPISRMMGHIDRAISGIMNQPRELNMRPAFAEGVARATGNTAQSFTIHNQLALVPVISGDEIRFMLERQYRNRFGTI